MGAFVGVVCVHDPDVGVVVGVGIGKGAIAGEGQVFAVGRPCGGNVVEITAGDLRERFGGQVEEVEVGAAAVEIAVDVFLELQAIDDPGFVGFFLFDLAVFVVSITFFVVGIFFGFVAHGFQFFGRGITKDEGDAAAVGRPKEVFDVLGGVGKLFGFTAEAVEEPDLDFAVVASAKEGDGFAVWAPAGVGGGGVCSGEGDGIGKRGAGEREGEHPDAALVVVVLKGGGGDDVGEPFGIGAELRFLDVADAEGVVDGDGALAGGWRSGLLGEEIGWNAEQGEQRDEAR